MNDQVGMEIDSLSSYYLIITLGMTRPTSVRVVFLCAQQKILINEKLKDLPSFPVQNI